MFGHFNTTICSKEQKLKGIQFIKRMYAKSMESSKAKLPCKQPNGFNNSDSIVPCSLVSYAKCVTQLGEKELQTLKATVLSRREEAKSGFKGTKSQNKHRKVQFTDYVVEKEQASIYLTRMVTEESEDSQWKSKLIIDELIIEKLHRQATLLIDKLKNAPVDTSVTTADSIGVAPKQGLVQPKKLPPSKLPQKVKRGPITKIYEHQLLRLVWETEQALFQDVSLPDWNKYLAGIFCFLNIRREVLSGVLQQNQQNSSIIIYLYNNQALQSYEVNDVFEQHGGSLSRCSAPLVLQNGKVQFWNCILDRFFREYSGRQTLKTKQFLQALFGLPVKQQVTSSIVMLSNYIDFYSKHFYLFVEDKTTCFYVQGIRRFTIDGEEYELVVVTTFQPQLITFGIKSSSLYEKCTYLQRLLIQDLQKHYRVLVLLQTFKTNFPKINVTCRLSHDFVWNSFTIGGRYILFMECQYPQNIILRITPDRRQTTFAFAQIYQQDSDIHFKSVTRGEQLVYHRIEEGYYEIQTSEKCKVQVISHSDLRLVQEIVEVRGNSMHK